MVVVCQNFFGFWEVFHKNLRIFIKLSDIVEDWILWCGVFHKAPDVFFLIWGEKVLEVWKLWLFWEWIQWLYNFWADEKLEVAWTVLSDVGSECYWKGQIRFSYNHFDGFYLVYIHHTVVLEVIEELIKNKSDILGLWRWIEGNIQSWKWVNVLGEGILVDEIWHGSVDFGEVVFVEYEGEDDVLCCIWDF